MDKSHLIYNIDEKGIQRNYSPTKVVASSQGVTSVISAEKSSTVTILGCGSAAGHQLPPYFVFSGCPQALWVHGRGNPGCYLQYESNRVVQCFHISGLSHEPFLKICSQRRRRSTCFAFIWWPQVAYHPWCNWMGTSSRCCSPCPSASHQPCTTTPWYRSFWSFLKNLCQQMSKRRNVNCKSLFNNLTGLQNIRTGAFQRQPWEGICQSRHISFWPPTPNPPTNHQSKSSHLTSSPAYPVKGNALLQSQQKEKMKHTYQSIRFSHSRCLR